jgi:hypothetical protein
VPLEIAGVRLGAVQREDMLGEWWSATTDAGPRTVRALKEGLLEREDARLLFAEEARRVATLPAASFLKVERAEPTAPWPWMLTESVEVPDLEKTLAMVGPRAPERALALARTAGEGLAALAARRQIHAAPIPARLLGMERGWVWLTFRDVRANDETTGLKGRRFADPRHAPPEMDAGHPEPLRAGPWSAWAIGAVLRAALGLGPPRGEDGVAKPLPPTTPPALARVLARLLEPAPRLRVPDATAALTLLAGGAETRDGPVPPRPLGPAPVPRPRAR